jgi:hypothetical protein
MLSPNFLASSSVHFGQKMFETGATHISEMPIIRQQSRFPEESNITWRS